MSGIVFAETILRELNNLAENSQKRKNNDMYGNHLHSCGKDAETYRTWSYRYSAV